VRAVGSHGQTVRHRPGEFDGIGYTLQLNAPALLAERCGIDVVADFRTRDVAAGGQGAPLVPGLPRGRLRRRHLPRAVLNIGGIANLTLLPDGRGIGRPTSTDAATLRGFDCGPGNALLDHWCRLHTGQPFDDDGRWAASGQVDTTLLGHAAGGRVVREAAAQEHRPRSLQRRLARRGAGRHRPAIPPTSRPRCWSSPPARPSTRCAPRRPELASCSSAAAARSTGRSWAASPPSGRACRSRRRPRPGLPPLQVEAAAFAWLARQCCERLPGNHPGVTGARGERILGAIYPHERHLAPLNVKRRLEGRRFH
jgi:anhydro-N-acetylmuramic acid kinase